MISVLLLPLAISRPPNCLTTQVSFQGSSCCSHADNPSALSGTALSDTDTKALCEEPKYLTSPADPVYFVAEYQDLTKEMANNVMAQWALDIADPAGYQQLSEPDGPVECGCKYLQIHKQSTLQYTLRFTINFKDQANADSVLAAKTAMFATVAAGGVPAGMSATGVATIQALANMAAVSTTITRQLSIVSSSDVTKQCTPVEKHVITATAVKPLAEVQSIAAASWYRDQSDFGKNGIAFIRAIGPVNASCTTATCLYRVEEVMYGALLTTVGCDTSFQATAIRGFTCDTPATLTAALTAGTFSNPMFRVPPAPSPVLWVGSYILTESQVVSFYTQWANDVAAFATGGGYIYETEPLSDITCQCIFPLLTKKCDGTYDLRIHLIAPTQAKLDATLAKKFALVGGTTISADTTTQATVAMLGTLPSPTATIYTLVDGTASKACTPSSGAVMLTEVTGLTRNESSRLTLGTADVDFLYHGFEFSRAVTHSADGTSDAIYEIVWPDTTLTTPGKAADFVSALTSTSTKLTCKNAAAFTNPGFLQAMPVGVAACEDEGYWEDLTPVVTGLYATVADRGFDYTTMASYLVNNDIKAVDAAIQCGGTMMLTTAHELLTGPRSGPRLDSAARRHPVIIDFWQAMQNLFVRERGMGFDMTTIGTKMLGVNMMPNMTAFTSTNIATFTYTQAMYDVDIAKVTAVEAISSEISSGFAANYPYYKFAIDLYEYHLFVVETLQGSSVTRNAKHTADKNGGPGTGTAGVEYAGYFSYDAPTNSYPGYSVVYAAVAAAVADTNAQWLDLRVSPVDTGLYATYWPGLGFNYNPMASYLANNGVKSIEAAIQCGGTMMMTVAHDLLTGAGSGLRVTANAREHPVIRDFWQAMQNLLVRERGMLFDLRNKTGTIGAAQLAGGNGMYPNMAGFTAQNVATYQYTQVQYDVDIQKVYAVEAVDDTLTTNFPSAYPYYKYAIDLYDYHLGVVEALQGSSVSKETKHVTDNSGGIYAGYFSQYRDLYFAAQRALPLVPVQSGLYETRHAGFDYRNIASYLVAKKIPSVEAAIQCGGTMMMTVGHTLLTGTLSPTATSPVFDPTMRSNPVISAFWKTMERIFVAERGMGFDLRTITVDKLTGMWPNMSMITATNVPQYEYRQVDYDIDVQTVFAVEATAPSLTAGFAASYPYYKFAIDLFTYHLTLVETLQGYTVNKDSKHTADQNGGPGTGTAGVEYAGYFAYDAPTDSYPGYTRLYSAANTAAINAMA